MRAERSESTSRDVVSEYERAAMSELLRDEHPWSRAELEREVAGSEGKRAEVGVAIEFLYRAGLIHLAGDLVLTTRAARYMHELTEESI
jgi:hypothetical protein